MKEGAKDGGGGHCLECMLHLPALVVLRSSCCAWKWRFASSCCGCGCLRDLAVSTFKGLVSFFLSVRNVGLPVARGLPGPPLARPISVPRQKTEQAPLGHHWAQRNKPRSALTHTTTVLSARATRYFRLAEKAERTLTTLQAGSQLSLV